ELLRTPLRELSPQQRSQLQQISTRCGQQDGGVTAALLLRSVLPEVSQETESSDAPLPSLLETIGFDSQQHEQIRAELRSGRYGLAQNRLPASTTIEDVRDEDVIDVRDAVDAKYHAVGRQAIQDGQVAVVTLAAGVGSRWTEGAGVCKALHPFAKMGGKHRSFLEVHLAKNRAARQRYDAVIPHVFTTSWLTDQPIRRHLDGHTNYGMGSRLHVSTGRSVGLRMVPMVRDLRFEWEETAQQVLDQQQQKVRESVRAALISWAQRCGEATDYTDNVPAQCMHPVGHWYEVPNLLRSGTLAKMLDQQPQLQTLLLHNIDTLGAGVDAGLLGLHLSGGQTLTFEVIPKRLEDRGGGLARVDGRPRLIEGLAMPDERIEFQLRYYNSMTTWIQIDALLQAMGLDRNSLSNTRRVDDAVRKLAARMPTYITLKDVKKRWGHAQEDIYPVAQFEKLWGDMTTIPEMESRYFVTTRDRGQQLKEQAQLDGWKQDGSADYIESLCDWGSS
ncbi:MAG: UTP--glucose-1-phosphate uridylyltransferase, partial [Planctomycetota bacterium]